MTTIRQAHRKKYVAISNQLLQNNTLSLKARGLMAYLLSLPDDWKVNINHLAKVLKEGRDAISSAFGELRAAGYVWYQKMGFKEGWTYWVFEDSLNEKEFKKFLRTNGFPNNWETRRVGKSGSIQKTNIDYKIPKPSQKTKKSSSSTHAHERGDAHTRKEEKKISLPAEEEKKFEVAQEQVEVFMAYSEKEGKAFDERSVKQWIATYGEEKVLQTFDFLTRQEKAGYKIYNLSSMMYASLKKDVIGSSISVKETDGNT